MVQKVVFIEDVAKVFYSKTEGQKIHKDEGNEKRLSLLKVPLEWECFNGICVNVFN